MDVRAKFPVRDSIGIPPTMVEAWQRLLDLMAEVFHVPAALIMRVHPHEIEVFLRSSNPENVYERGERAPLDAGLYCETVMQSRRPLLVPNALGDPEWDHNPDVRLGMIAYLGVPLLWPTGELFGTMCVLDQKENRFSETYIRLLEQLRSVAEHDLRLIDAGLQLSASEIRYRTVFNTVMDRIIVSSRDGRILDTNEVAREQTGLVSSELPQRRVTDVIHMPCDWATEVLPTIDAKGVMRCEGEQSLADGNRTPVELHIVPMTLGGEEAIVTVAHDISERKSLERELHRLAFTDPLTGIGNRGGFENAIHVELAHAERYGRPLSIAMLDLDHFKQVNDRFGHEAGDRTLRHVCDVAGTHLRHADQFFRYGGEEFVILMPETSLEGATHLAERIRHAIAASPLEGIGVVTVSIGVTEHHAGEPRNSLVNRVDAALYESKSAGRNRVSVA